MVMIYRFRLFDKILKYANNGRSFRSCQSLVITGSLGDVCLIGLNRPESCNALTATMLRELRDAFDWFEGHDKLITAVLHGEGRLHDDYVYRWGSFSVGYDDGEFERNTEVVKIMEDIWKLDRRKVLVAAVDGRALGAGMELACLCDIRVIEENSHIGLNRDRNGFLPLSSSLATRLPLLIGLSHATDLVLTGRPVKGNEACSMGLANLLVATGTAIGRATQIASNISRFPQGSLQRDRKLLLDMANASLPHTKTPATSDKIIHPDAVLLPR